MSGVVGAIRWMREDRHEQRCGSPPTSNEICRRHSTIEIETLKAPKRIEKLAIEQLHLVAPQRGQAIVIERVTPVQPPEKSVVASR